MLIFAGNSIDLSIIGACNVASNDGNNELS